MSQGAQCARVHRSVSNKSNLTQVGDGDDTDQRRGKQPQSVDDTLHAPSHCISTFLPSVFTLLQPNTMIHTSSETWNTYVQPTTTRLTFSSTTCSLFYSCTPSSDPIHHAQPQSHSQTRHPPSSCLSQRLTPASQLESRFGSTIRCDRQLFHLTHPFSRRIANPCSPLSTVTQFPQPHSHGLEKQLCMLSSTYSASQQLQLRRSCTSLGRERFSPRYTAVPRGRLFSSRMSWFGPSAQWWMI